MKKQEMKVFSMYEGWDKEQKKRSSLVEKTMFAGMESSQIFHEKREALIEKKYNADAIQQRIHMGVQESQNCTVITMRMKHRRMRWFNLSCPNERGDRNIKCSKSTKKRRKGKSVCRRN